jgi:hypothetical protein
VPNVGMTPYEKKFKVKLDLSHIMIFRCNAHVHLKKENKVGKFESKSLVCMLVGYDIVSKAYKFFEPISQQIIINRNVMFLKQNTSL